MPHFFISFGSNLGDRKAQIEDAISELQKSACRLIKKSGFYETEPWGKKDQPWFLNACAEMETELSPQQLLILCQSLEQKFGRPQKHEKWGPRFLDVDILFYGDIILRQVYDKNNADLQIPHPQIQNRRFILIPLAEIAPNFAHPVLKKTIKRLLKECVDSSIVRPFP